MRRSAIVFASVCLASLGWGASTAFAAATNVFDATASLTGDCSTSSWDTVPDPGCPGGTHPGPFEEPSTVAIDRYGDLYVAERGAMFTERGRIDIFGPSGRLIDTMMVHKAQQIAVDSQGYLYASSSPENGPLTGGEGNTLLRYTPAPGHYDPEAGEIEYEEPPTVITSYRQVNLEGGGGYYGPRSGFAVDPSDDHLYLNLGTSITEYGSAAEGNPVIDKTIAAGQLGSSSWIAVDGRNHDIYVGSSEEQQAPATVQVFGGGPSHPLLRTISGFQSVEGLVSTAIDEATGDVFVDDIQAPTPRKKVYEFAPSAGNQTVGEAIAVYEHNFRAETFPQVEVANGPSPRQGYLFVPSGGGTPGHVYAFRPLPTPKAPKIEALSLSDVTAGEAAAHATVNPEGSPTTYYFELAAARAVEEEGFASATRLGEGALPGGAEGVGVSASAEGLLSATTYVVRVVAENECEAGGCRTEREITFRTYPAPIAPGGCPNDPLRIGPSAGLPDCRAYELVSPGATSGRALGGIGYSGLLFPTPQSTPDGNSVAFLSIAGSLPGTDATGSLQGDPYLATRSAGGWATSLAGPTGAESQEPTVGGVSADHGFTFWLARAGDQGSKGMSGQETSYVRYPDGDSEPIGRGSLATEPNAIGDFIASDGSHIIFSSRASEGLRLEPDAPPAGTSAIYDRTADEVTHVVSLLPGDVTPASGEKAKYLGATPDGSAVAFKIGSVLYLRQDDQRTVEVAVGASAFAGISADGRTVSYAKGGNLFSFDADSGATTQITSSGDATFVNVSADGTHVYFVSPSVLTTEANPQGDVAQPGAENLYLFDGQGTRFVGTVTERDVSGENTGSGTPTHIDGLGLWAEAVEEGAVSADPSRSTPDGSVLLFSSRAELTGYESQGHVEIYRYDAARGQLACLSCNPTMLPATGDASLVSVGTVLFAPQPFSARVQMPNLRSDGRRAFFQSTEALVPQDTDGLQDVYEWEEQGVGTCAEAGGCLRLISSGHSARNNYLFGVSASGDDVFFLSNDQLLPSDLESTASIYDARVDGGLPEAQTGGACEGEGCRPRLTPAPVFPSPASAASSKSVSKRCHKGRRLVTKHGHKLCLRKKRGATHHRWTRHHHRNGAAHRTQANQKRSAR